MSGPQKYRKNPVEIQAVQWDGTAEGASPILDWIIDNGGYAKYFCSHDMGCPGTAEGHTISIRTLEGSILASPGDWVIRGVAGEFYPCKPSIFATTYTAVAPPEAEAPRSARLRVEEARLRLKEAEDRLSEALTAGANGDDQS